VPRVVCLDMKEGENIRDLKRLQVDLKFNKVFKGRQDRTCSSNSSGRRLQIAGSISGNLDGDCRLFGVMGWRSLPEAKPIPLCFVFLN
jgi:hypothetical protein